MIAKKQENIYKTKAMMDDLEIIHLSKQTTNNTSNKPVTLAWYTVKVFILPHNHRLYYNYTWRKGGRVPAISGQKLNYGNNHI